MIARKKQGLREKNKEKGVGKEVGGPLRREKNGAGALWRARPKKSWQHVVALRKLDKNGGEKKWRGCEVGGECEQVVSAMAQGASHTRGRNVGETFSWCLKLDGSRSAGVRVNGMREG